MTKRKWLVAGAALLVIAVISGVIVWLTNRSEAQACPNPTIKGNISIRTGEKIYHLPSDRYYSATQISPNIGERMFCTTGQAEAAGWRHAKSN